MCFRDFQDACRGCPKAAPSYQPSLTSGQLPCNHQKAGIWAITVIFSADLSRCSRQATGQSCAPSWYCCRFLWRLLVSLGRPDEVEEQPKPFRSCKIGVSLRISLHLADTCKLGFTWVCLRLYRLHVLAQFIIESLKNVLLYPQCHRLTADALWIQLTVLSLEEVRLTSAVTWFAGAIQEIVFLIMRLILFSKMS